MKAQIDKNFSFLEAENFETALGLVRTENFGLVLIDWRSNSDSCLNAVKMMLKDYPNLGIIAAAGQEQYEELQPLTQFYLDDIVIFPVDPEDLELHLKEVQQRVELMDKNGIIGRTEVMRNTINTLMQVAPTQVTVFISGESGTGKEILARAIHYKSSHRFKPFIAINCGAIAETLLESELFGYEKGAFTGAVSKTKGKFEVADKGTLFLDEVGEMSANTQIKFLRVLEEQEFMRVGGTETIKVDVRVITATNANLEEAVQKGTFRRDLYYRLKVFSIHLPPLRDHQDDIPLLVNLFINRFCKENHLHFQGITHEAYRRLMKYDWPGNIRELRNIVESIVIMQPQRQITERDIDSYLKQKQFSIFPQISEPQFHSNLPVFVNKPIDQVEREMIFQAVKALHKEVLEIRMILEERLTDVESSRLSKPEPGQTAVDNQLNLSLGISMEEIEKEVIIKTLRLYRGNKKKTAESLKIGLRTLYRKLELYSIEDYY